MCQERLGGSSRAQCSIEKEKLRQEHSLPTLEPLRRRPHVQLMRPQTRLLVVQPQIRLAHGIGAHLLPDPLVLAILILDPAIGNRMHDVHALLAELARCTATLPACR